MTRLPSLLTALLLIFLPFSSPFPHSSSSHRPLLLHPRDNCTLPAPLSKTPNPCGCTRTSFSSWSWTLTDFYFHSSVIFSTPSHQIDGGWVSFTLAHPAVPDTKFGCDAASTQLHDWFYGDQEFNCTARAIVGGEGKGYGGGGGGDGEEEEGLAGKARFRFDRSSGRVDVVQSWVCAEDPVYP